MSDIRRWMQLAASLQEVATLLEAFTQPLALTYNAERTQEIEAQLPGIKVVKAFDANVLGIDLEFVEFMSKGAWEVHFNNRSADNRKDDEIVGAVLKDSSMTKIIATLILILERRFRDGRPIRYYADSERLRLLYDKVFAMLNATEFKGNILRYETPNFHAPSGKMMTAVVLKLDMRTLPVPNPRIDEARHLMQEASASALIG